jgi:hypothetical protein
MYYHFKWAIRHDCKKKVKRRKVACGPSFAYENRLFLIALDISSQGAQ